MVARACYKSERITPLLPYVHVGRLLAYEPTLMANIEQVHGQIGDHGEIPQ